MASREEQRLRDLREPSNLPEARGEVDVRSTHGSLVFLTGESVYKIKRAKDYGFFDYTTLVSRRHYCEEEVRLNRRAAPEIYLGVLPVYRDAAGYSMNRPGEIVDWAVHMRRLPDERSALGLLRGGELGEEELSRVAARAAQFYREVEEKPADPDALRANIQENFEQVASFEGDLVDAETVRRTRELQESWLERCGAELARRPCRDGHGDLRLEHVYLLGDDVIFLDCIEFAERFRVADPALDAAFLAMDLRRHGRVDLAEWLVARFAYESDDYDAYPLIDGYVSYRAFVRAKVACFVAVDPATEPAVAERKREESAALFALALEAMTGPDGTGAENAPPTVIGVGGMIAAGKSTTAERLARRLHVPVVSADATRKHLAGLDKLDRGGSEIYSPSFTAGVHDELLRRVSVVVGSGRSVILDTSFQTRELRAKVRSLAEEFGAGFRMVECRVPEEEARRRLAARTGGVSDAREDLFDTFAAGFEAIRELPDGELVVLDTTLPEPAQVEVLRRAGLW